MGKVAKLARIRVDAVLPAAFTYAVLKQVSRPGNPPRGKIRTEIIAECYRIESRT
jgi:hypothetical protein